MYYIQDTIPSPPPIETIPPQDTIPAPGLTEENNSFQLKENSNEP